MNKTGRAGRGGLRAEACVAFLDHYTTENKDGQKRINGVVLSPNQRRQIRRWRHGDTAHVNPAGFLRLLHELEFTLPWFHRWCRMHNVKVTE